MSARVGVAHDTAYGSDVNKVQWYQQLSIEPVPSAGGAAQTRNGAGVEIVEIPASLAGQRVDNFLLSRLKGVPRSLVYKWLRRGEIRVNKGRVRPAQRLEAGDLVRLPPVRAVAPGQPRPPPTGILHELAAAVLYEDERLLVLDKPAGMAVHGGSGISAGVIEGLRASRPASELELVHRLDRDTSGCLLISKRRSALRSLHRQMREGAVDKRYRALLAGQLPRHTTPVDLPLRKNQLRGGERMVQVDLDQGKPARTIFRCVATYGGVTLADVELHTGRTHQIRVHAASLGAPVVGDDKYGDAQVNGNMRKLGLKRLFLHACSLSFHGREGAPVITVQAPLPSELTELLRRLEKQA